MNDVKVSHWAGAFGLAGTVLFVCELPLWVIPGPAPMISDGLAHGQFLASIRVIALTRVLLDLGMYVCLMIFFAGFRNLIQRARADYEWVATLVFGSGIVWWAVTLVADSLQGAAVLDTLGGKADPTAVRTLVEGTLLIYNGSIAFVVTGLFMGTAAYAILATGALPKWIGWVACASAVLCLAAVPSMYADAIDGSGFYNPGGWGSAIIANLPPLAWFLVTSIAMMRKREIVAPISAQEAR